MKKENNNFTVSLSNEANRKLEQLMKDIQKVTGFAVTRQSVLSKIVMDYKLRIRR